MDEKLKQRITDIRKKIQLKEYQQALDDCDYVFIMMTNKVASVHLFAGFCYEKLKNDTKAEREYKEAEELQPKNVDSFKALYALYTRNKHPSAAQYLRKLCDAYKTYLLWLYRTDKGKFREHYIKLVKFYQADQNLQTIHKMLEEMKEEKQVTPEMVALGQAYLKLSTEDKSFDITVIAALGMQRQLLPESRESLDYLLMNSIKYLKLVSYDYKLTPESICDSIMYLKGCFPECGAALLMLLYNDFAVTHVEMVEVIMTEIYLLLSAYFTPEAEAGKNYYAGAQFIHPEVFLASMILSHQYLAFFSQFFNLAEPMKPLYLRLATEQGKLRKELHNEEHQRYIDDFVLTEALAVSRMIDTDTAYQKLGQFRDRAKKYGGFVEQVVARLAMKVFKDYKELTDMKNVLKVRISKEPDNFFLLKYYYDYLIRISRSYKVFDEELDIQEIVDKILALDENDHRYRSERVWLRFSQAVYNEEQDLTVFQQLQDDMRTLTLKAGISTEDLAAFRKKLLIMEVYSRQAKDIQQQLLEILKIDPKNYHTYVCLGVERYMQGSLQEALDYFRRGFLLYQRDYHLNRYLYTCLIGLGQHKEAAEFVTKIYMGFKSVYWINYVLAMHHMNSKQFESAQTYLTKAIESFTAGRARTYDLSFEKLQERPEYSFPYLIRQNKYRILDQYIIVPEAVLFKHIPILSNHYYKDDKCPSVKLVEVRMWVQMAEILKVLGRLSTVLKCLNDARELADKAGFLRQCQKWTVNSQNEPMFLQVVQLYKELAAVSYYCGSSKEAELMLEKSMAVNDKLISLNTRYSSLTAELLALKFEIGIERLSLTMRFQSYETTSNFISNLKVPECSAPTVPYLKSFYQYQLLCYLHQYKNPQRGMEAIAKFLARFNLDYLKIGESEFSNGYFNLAEEDRKQVKQAIEDLLVFVYMVQLNHSRTQIQLSKEYVLKVLEILSDSPILYILYGILQTDPQIKTGAFLKCIEMDKQNAISVDYLAYLYLNNRNLMAAAKLYLKSVQLNPLSLKSYIGLTITLFSIFLRCQAGKTQSYQPIIEASMAKVKAYLEYLQVANPTIEYSLIDFFQLLLTSSERESNFDRTLRLDSGLRAYSYMQRVGKTIRNHFTEKVLEDIPLGQLWKETPTVLLSKLSEQLKLREINTEEDMAKLSVRLVADTNDGITALTSQSDSLGKELLAKHVENLYSKATTALLLSCKVHSKNISEILDLFDKLQKLESELRLPANQQNLRAIKLRLLNFSLSHEGSIKERIESLFSSVETAEFHLKQALKKGESAFKRCIATEMLRDPTNQVVRRHLNTVLTVRYRKYMQTKMRETDKGRLLNQALESAEKRIQALTKLVMLYNEPSGWLMLVYEKFKILGNRTQSNLKYWLKLVRMNSIFKAKAHSLNSHCRSLFVQMYAWLEKHYGRDAGLYATITEDAGLQSLYEQFKEESEAISSLEALSKTKTIKRPEFSLTLVHSLVEGAVPTRQLHDVLANISQTHHSSNDYAYLMMLRFVAAVTAQHASSDLDELESARLLQDSIPLVKDTLTNLLIRMTVALILRNYKDLDQLLIRASQAYLSNQHEVLLTCYFDIMLNYEKLLTSPEDPQLFEGLRNYIERTLEMCQDRPELASFLHYLHSLVLLKFGDSYGIGKEEARRSVFKSIWLNPSVGRQIIKKIKGA